MVDDNKECTRHRSYLTSCCPSPLAALLFCSYSMCYWLFVSVRLSFPFSYSCHFSTLLAFLQDYNSYEIKEVEDLKRLANALRDDVRPIAANVVDLVTKFEGGLHSAGSPQTSEAPSA